MKKMIFAIIVEDLKRYGFVVGYSDAERSLYAYDYPIHRFSADWPVVGKAYEGKVYVSVEAFIEKYSPNIGEEQW